MVLEHLALYLVTMRFISLHLCYIYRRHILLLKECHYMLLTSYTV